MDLIIGLSVLFSIVVLGAIFLFSFPTVVIGLALWLYRYGRKQENWQHRHAAKLDEAWIRELEK